MILHHDLHNCQLLILKATFDYEGDFSSVLFSHPTSSLNPNNLYETTIANFSIVVFQPPKMDLIVSNTGPVRSNSRRSSLLAATLSCVDQCSDSPKFV